MFCGMTVEKAQKKRKCRSPYNFLNAEIKKGEKCLTIWQKNGWRASVKKEDAIKMLKECLEQLEDKNENSTEV